MRRTEQEFKEELLKRTKVYRQERARKHKRMLGAGMCACLCLVVLKVIDPFGASSEAAAPMDDMKIEYAVSMQMVGEDNLCADEAPAENVAAPVAPDCGTGIVTDNSVAEPEEAGEETERLDVSVSIRNGENSWPLDQVDAAIIAEYLSADGWIMSAANCLCDYTVYANGETYHYHSECGTIQDEFGKSLPLPEMDKVIFNEILQKYVN